MPPKSRTERRVKTGFSREQMQAIASAIFESEVIGRGNDPEDAVETVQEIFDAMGLTVKVNYGITVQST